MVAGEKIEILVVNDGSNKDNTASIADEYAEKYPEIIRAIHKENGGHGDAVNIGMRNATGKYFKVVDSDDWVDAQAFLKVISFLESMHSRNEDIDLLFTNFVYNKVGVKHNRVMKYTSALPQNRVFTWEDKLKINKAQYILMHSVTYRLDILKECNLELPKNTFYVDNIYLYKPLPYVKKMYYLDANLYQYFIGRDDQSVNEKVMIGRIDQQIRVNKILIDIYGQSVIKHRELKKYMLQYMDMMMCVASVMLILANTDEALEKKEKLWKHLKTTNPELHRYLRKTIFGIWMNLPGKVGRFFSVLGYKVVQKVFGFN